MTTSLMLAAAALLLSANAPAATEQQDRLKATQAQRDVCYLLATEAADLLLADCLNFADAPGPLFRTEVCNFLRDTEQLEDFGFTSHPECVRPRHARRWFSPSARKSARSSIFQR